MRAEAVEKVVLMPRELVLMPFLADVETDWIPAELTTTLDALVLAAVEIV